MQLWVNHKSLNFLIENYEATDFMRYPVAFCSKKVHTGRRAAPWNTWELAGDLALSLSDRWRLLDAFPQLPLIFDLISSSSALSTPVSDLISLLHLFPPGWWAPPGPCAVHWFPHWDTDAAAVRVSLGELTSLRDWLKAKFMASLEANKGKSCRLPGKKTHIFLGFPCSSMDLEKKRGGGRKENYRVISVSGSVLRN